MPGLTQILNKTMLPGIVKGMKVTLTHLLTPRRKKMVPTVQYPEEKAPVFERSRGIHFMKTDDKGRANCVACFMCSTACPADAISIVAKPAPADWEGRDVYPETYAINELRCIFCGMCEQACPKDAIHLSTTQAPVFHSRQEAIYGLHRLMQHYGDVKASGQVCFD
jgi:NADH-quinone oxidoreductase subunit I